MDMTPIENTPFVGLWPQSTKEIDCGPFLSFVVSRNKILQISIMRKGKFRLRGTQKWYKLPCQENDLVEVFGKPTKTYEWFRE